MKILQTALLCACAIAGQASATPVFQLGVDNNMGFQSVANKTNSASVLAVGDLYYGVINVQDIATGNTSWNANNVSAPIDSFSGYFLTQVTSVTATTVPGLGTFYSAQLGVATVADPNGIFSATDLAAGTMMKLYTDTGTAYTTGGPVATDIAHATDGSLWASLGFTSASNYWTLAVAPGGFAATGSSFGGLNFITNNSGLTWAKVLDTNCAVVGGCLEDMKFVSTFSQTSGGAWQASINDPAVLHPVPLPAAGWLLGSGLMGLLGLSGRRKRRAALAQGI